MNKPCIYFGKLSKKYWFIILTAFFYSLRNLLTFEESYKEQFKKNPFLDIFAKLIGKSLNLILYIIYRETHKKAPSDLVLIFQEREKCQKIIVPAWFLLMAICNLLISLIIAKNDPTSVSYSAFVVVNLLVISGFSMLLLKSKYHRHHLLGLGIFFIGLIVKLIIYRNDKLQDTIVLLIVFNSINNIAMGIQEVVEKYIMDKKYIHPLLVIGLEGVLGLILIIITLLIVGPFHCAIDIDFCQKDTFDDFFDSFKIILNEHYLVYFRQIILNFLSNLFRIYSNFFFSPTHRILSNEIGRLFVLIVTQIIKYFSDESIEVKSIGIELMDIIFEGIGISIFVELIIITLYNMDINVASEITRRENTELTIDNNSLLRMEKNMKVKVSQILRETNNNPEW